MKRVILDTNIILRIADKTGPDHDRSYSIVKRLISEDYEAAAALAHNADAIATLNVQDFTNFGVSLISS